MNPKDLFVDIQAPSYILLILETMAQKKSIVKVWQNIQDTHRSYECVIKEVRPKTGELVVSFLEPDPLLYKAPCFFNGPHRGSLFKTQIKKLSLPEMVIQMPEMVKLREGRREERVNHSSDSGLQIIIKFDDEFEILADIVDTSASGLGVFVDKKFIHSLKLSEKVKVFPFTYKDVDPMGEYQIRNLTRVPANFGDRSKKLVRIGMMEL